MLPSKKIYYIYDPMCSWCWGYKPVWNEIERKLGNDVQVIYVLGGLAPDTDEPMPEEMQRQIASYWKKIENFLGTEFNYEFWEKNTPRRSTYPSCRATLAARMQGAEKQMLEAIQHAYYLHAQNPSDNDILIGLAENIGLDTTKFKEDFTSPQVHQALLEEINFSRMLGGNGFPSVCMESSEKIYNIPVDYQNPQATVDAIRSIA
ncbi:DsbA family protein [Vibrio sp. RC27]